MTSLKARLRRLVLGRGYLRRRAREAAAIDRLSRRLARLQHPGVAAPGFAPGLEAYELSIHSQYGEDGIVLYLLDAVGVDRRVAVEIGIEDGRQCNTTNLVLTHGWRAVQIEADAAKCRAAEAFFAERLGADAGRCTVVNAHVTAENVDAVLAGAGAGGAVDVFSLDIDGNDYWVWKALTAIEPRVAVIEYNASFGAERRVTIPYDPGFSLARHRDKPYFHGASLAALAGLGRDKGYVLAGCESAGVNAFFVRADLARAAGIAGVDAAAAFRPHARRCERTPHEAQVARTAVYPLVEV